MLRFSLPHTTHSSRVASCPYKPAYRSVVSSLSLVNIISFIWTPGLGTRNINLVGPIDISPLNVYAMQWTAALVTNSQYALDRTSTLTPLKMVPGNSPSICGGVIPTSDFHKKGQLKGSHGHQLSPCSLFTIRLLHIDQLFSQQS